MSDLRSANNILEFEKFANVAAETEHGPAVEFLRNVVGRVSHTCPVPVLVALARVVVEARKKELRKEASGN